MSTFDGCARHRIDYGSVDAALRDRGRAYEQQQSEYAHGDSAFSVTLREQERDGVGDYGDGAGKEAEEFAIGLDVHRGIGDRTQFDAVRPNDANAFHAAEAIDQNAEEESNVVFPAVAFEDDHFKIVVGEANLPGDFEIASVVADSGEESEGCDAVDAIDGDAEAALMAADLPQTAVPVGQLAELLFEIEIEFVNDAGIESNTGHQKEMARGLAFELNESCPGADGYGIEKFGGRAVWSAAQSDFAREHVCSARRKGAENDLRADDAVEDFVDGAVAAGGQKKVEAAVDGVATEFAGHVGTGGGQELHVPASASKALDSGVETRPFGAFQSACTGVEDDGYALEWVRDNWDQPNPRL